MTWAVVLTCALALAGLALALLCLRARRAAEIALDTIRDAVVITGPDDRIERANRSFASLLRTEPSELVGQSLRKVLARHPDRWLEIAQGSVTVEDPAFDSVFEVSARRVGRRVIRLARDIGAERRLFARLVQNDKMAALGLLATGVAHEIINPAFFVDANLEELQLQQHRYDALVDEVLKATGSPAPQADRVAQLRGDLIRFVEDAREGTERLKEIAETLRSVAKKDHTCDPPRAVSLREVLDVVLKTARARLRTIPATVRIEDDCQVLGYRGQLVQVALNLVVNAIQSEAEGRPNEIRVALAEEDGEAVLSVQDTGKGIPPTHRERLFEPFFSTKPEGTGLGLTIAQQIVKTHRGSIAVTSEVGVGSTFMVRLPLLPPPPAAVAAPQPEEPRAAEPAAEARRLRVLVVDDEPALLRVVQHGLSRWFDVRTVQDGPSALRELAEGEFDIVLCDLSMPGMSGVELHTRAGSLDPRLPLRFVFFTSGALDDATSRFLATSGSAVVQKPVDIHVLAEKIREAHVAIVRRLGERDSATYH